MELLLLSVYAGSTVKSSAEHPAASSIVLQVRHGETTTTDGVETSFGGGDRLLCEEADGGYFNDWPATELSAFFLAEDELDGDFTCRVVELLRAMSM
jgi:hypothetical protein